MPKVTIAVGIVLVLIGLGAYALTGHHPHSFIPVGFGFVLAILGVLANTPDTKRRALLMHIAVTAGLLGFLGTIPGLIGVTKMALGQATARPDAAKVQALMGTVCLIFVLLCVRSFIEARKARTA